MSEFTEFDENSKNTDNTTSEEQQFITEKIVSKRKKKWFRRLITFIFVILCAIVFGIVARYFFLISGDALVEILGIEIPVYRETVYVYKDKTPTPLPKPSATPIVSRATLTPRVLATPTPTVAVTPTHAVKTTPEPSGTPQVTAVITPEASATPGVDVTPSGTVTETPVPTPGAETTQTAELTPTPTPVEGMDPGKKDGDDEKPVYSYVKFMEEVMSVTEDVKGSIASVDGISTGTDFLGNIYEIRTNTTGLILNQDGVDILILTDYLSIEDSASVEVTFEGDEKAYPGEIYNYDKDLGLAIIGVAISSLDQEKLEGMQYAVMCEEEEIKVGSPVFELGRANGYPDSLSFGLISSRNNHYEVKDAEICYFTTDWLNYSGASGFAFNMDGKVLGILTHTIKADAEDTLPCFITLCALEDELNILLNGGHGVYFGILANALPRKIKYKGSVEYGIFLNQVMAASPAYTAGLRAGDVITAINGQSVSNMEEFMDVLSSSFATQALNVSYVRSYAGGFKEMSAYVILGAK